MYNFQGVTIMPNFNDYHAFKSTDGGGGGGSGCSGNGFLWIIVILFILWAIGKITG